METDATPKKKPTILKQWRWTRRIVQTLFLLVFLYLLVGTVQGATGRLPNDLFFFIDPLTGITSMLASRSWIAPMALGAITLVLAVATGRAWCGWVCPLGTILDWTPSHCNRENPTISPRWSQTKHFLLFDAYDTGPDNIAVSHPGQRYFTRPELGNRGSGILALQLRNATACCGVG